MHHTVYDVSHMPSFVNCLLCIQKEKEIKEAEVDRTDMYDELLDKFCFGTNDASVIKRVLSKL